MRLLFLPLICVAAFTLTSCGLLRTATELPLRTLESVTRTIGVSSQVSELEGEENVKVEFERDSSLSE